MRECRLCVVLLDVRVRLVESDTDGDHRKLGGKQWVIFDCLAHGEVGELMSKYDGTPCVEFTSFGSVDQIIVVGVNVFGGDTGGFSVAPVVGIPRPQYARKVQSSRDRADTVVDIAIRRAPARWGYTSRQFDHLDLEI